MTVIEPEYMNQLMDAQREKMIETNPNMTEAQMEQAIAITS